MTHRIYESYRNIFYFQTQWKYFQKWNETLIGVIIEPRGDLTLQCLTLFDDFNVTYLSWREEIGEYLDGNEGALILQRPALNNKCNDCLYPL